MAKKVEGTEKLDTGISIGNTRKVADELNNILADEFVLYLKTLKFHWNIEGKDFHALHVFLEEQYSELQTVIDEVAERIRKIGNFSNGSMKQFLADCSLKEHTETGVITESMLLELVTDHESLIRKLRELIDIFDKKYMDMGSSDFVVGLMKKHEKMAWMLRASTR